MEAWREELYSSELFHHGVKGQKWGVRRYQKADGTLTPLGKKHNAQLKSQPSSGGGGGGGPIDDEELKKQLEEQFDKELEGLTGEEREKKMLQMWHEAIKKSSRTIEDREKYHTDNVTEDWLSKASVSNSGGERFSKEQEEFVKWATVSLQSKLAKAKGSTGKHDPDPNNDPERRNIKKLSPIATGRNGTYDQGSGYDARNPRVTNYYNRSLDSVTRAMSWDARVKKEARLAKIPQGQHVPDPHNDPEERAPGAARKGAKGNTGRYSPDNTPASDSMDNRRYAATHTPQGKSAVAGNAKSDARIDNESNKFTWGDWSRPGTVRLTDETLSPREMTDSIRGYSMLKSKNRALVRTSAKRSATAEANRIERQYAERTGKVAPNASQNVQRDVRSNLLDKPDNVSKEYWEEYKSNGGTLKSFQESRGARAEDRVKVRKKSRYVRHSEFTIGGNYLMHYGIKGQKWGIRRYQNEDGTYTDAGKKRYLSGSGEFTSSGKRKYGRDLTKELNRLEQEYAYSVGKQNKAQYDATKQLGKLKKHADNLKKELEKHPERASDDGPSFKKAKDKAINIALKYNDAVRRHGEASSEIQKGEKETWKLLARAAETGMTAKSRVVGRYTSNGEEILTRQMAFFGGVAAIPVMLARAKIKESKGTPVAINTNKWKVKPSKDGQAYIQAPAAGLQPEDPDKKKRN